MSDSHVKGNASSRRVFIWVAHPGTDTLSHGLADAYQKGCESVSGVEVRRMDLGQMQFNADTYAGYDDEGRELEPDLVAWQEGIAWANHLFFIHLLVFLFLELVPKAVLDRAFTPGFAFKYKGRGLAWEKLLAGRTADVVITSDTPPLLDTLIFGKPGRKVLKNQVLGFSGIKARKVLQFGSVKTADEAKIRKWLKQAEGLGRSWAM